MNENEQIRENVLSACLKSGALYAAYLPADSIVYDRSFRDICKSNSCGHYGKCYMCPPDCGDINTLMESVQQYRNCVLWESVGKLEDSFDIEGMIEAKKAHMNISVKAAAAVAELGINHLYLDPGACGICTSCQKKEGLPCVHPELAHTSPEACGIFVSETAKRAGLKYINGKNTVTYFSMILF